MIDEKERVRKAREQYEAKQARQKRVQDAFASAEKPGVLLKLSIVLAGCLIIGLGYLDPVLKLFGLNPH